MPAPLRPLYAGEEVLVELRPHWVVVLGPLVTTLAVIAAAVALDLGLPHEGVAAHWIEGAVAAVPLTWLVVRFVRWRTTTLAITTMRVVERWGVVTRYERETPLAVIEQVDVVQSLPRRVLGTGALELTVVDDDEIRIVPDVRKPVVVRRIINRRRPPLPGFQPVPR